jgi:hypothetical protein
VVVTGEEIRRRLVELAEKWSVYEGSERAEAQTFLNQLFACYGTRREDVARFEEAQHGKFLDLVWPRVCLIEMKRPSEAHRLRDHRAQAFSYWRRAADPEANLPAPRYVVLCAFRRFEVWEPGGYPEAPRAEFDILDLPDRADALLFLAGREPVFLSRQEGVTRAAVGKLTDLFQRLGDRRAAPPDELRDLVLQAVWCMFAEDLGQLEGHTFTRIIEELIASPQRSSADDLGGLFAWLNTPGERPTHGLYADTRYVNGTLFANAARVHLARDELEALREVCGYDWRRVEPHIFGSLLEGALGRDAQWALGAHYTHEADIRKAVGPSIVEPWRERIGNVESQREAARLQADLLDYVVLDPACGSGNFLYVAYRELRRLEQQLRERERELRRDAGMSDQGALSAFFPLDNIRGIELDAFAVALARVTLWMGHKLAVDELGLAETTLPLEDLSGIQVGDALRQQWPASSVIVGNPPFHGDRQIRGVLGDEYIRWLQQEFGIGVKDHCVYWFRKAHDHLAPGQRAGLVGTNSVAQNRGREESLGYITSHGGVITNAVSTQVWPGLANVHVAIVNWIKEPKHTPSLLVLDGKESPAGISPSLRRADLAVDAAVPLEGNRGRAFIGPVINGEGFIVARELAEDLLAKGEAWRDVIRPYLVGEDIVRRPDQSPSRWVIDFGFRTLELAMEFPEALEIVRRLVKPHRDQVRRDTYRTNWWRFAEPIRLMREALRPLSRYVASPAQGKRILYSWQQPWTCPSNLTIVLAFDDDYSMGVLSSSIHTAWTRAQASTLKGDLRYTPTTVFATLAWPDPTTAQRGRVAAAGRALVARRDELCVEGGIGLTELYNLLDDGAYRDLEDLHRQLDEAVAAAYGWPAAAGRDPDEITRRLLSLNGRVAARELPYEPFGDPR